MQAQSHSPAPPPKIIDPDLSSIHEFDLSPDGARLLWLGEHQGERWVYSRLVNDSKSRLLPFAPGLSHPHWAGDNRHIYVLSDATGDEQDHLLLYDADHPEQPPRDLTPFPGKKALLVDVNNPDGSALVGLNLQSAQDFGLYKVTQDGSAPILVDPPASRRPNWLVTLQGQWFGHMQITEQGKIRVETRPPGRKNWQSFELMGDFSRPGDEVLGFSNPLADNSAWVLARHGQDVATAQRLDLASGEVKESIASDPVDTDSIVFDRDWRPLIMQSVPDYPALRIFDPALKKLLESVPLPIHAVLKGTSFDLPVNRLLLKFQSDIGEENLVFIDRSASVAQILYHQAPSLLLAQAPKTVPISLRARDSLQLHGYLTLPPDQPPQHQKLVLLVHGGPWVRDQWGFDFNALSLAMQGYAVLRVNYRGSGGYGRRFEDEGKGQWGAKMQDDLTDAVCWAVKQGVADPANIAIMGGSYGGYAAVEALERTPTLFVAAIEQDGPLDLPAMMDELQPYSRPYMPIFDAFIGADRATLWDRSPLAHLDRIARPVLAFQGDNDPRVRRSQLEKLETAMRSAGKPITADYLADEGHGIHHGRNVLPVAEKISHFLKQNFDQPSLASDPQAYCP